MLSSRIQIKTEELVHTIRNVEAKVLLLLDGYDEVAIAASQPGLIKNVMDEISKFKFVIVTSRPNALNQYLESKFDLHVESVGFNGPAIEEYV